MKDSCFADSNICIYLFSVDKDKATIAPKIFESGCVISTQVLSETSNVLIKKLNFSKLDAQKAIRFIANNAPVKLISPELIDSAFELAIRYQFSYYDSLIVASAIDAQCNILYSEDLQHNQIIEKKLTIQNPFKS